MKRISRAVVGYLLIALFSLSPVLVAIGSGMIAGLFGCRVDEGSAHPCVILGHDFGSTFYTLGVLGWFALGTFPLGLLLAAGWTVYLVVRRKRKAAAEPPTPTR